MPASSDREWMPNRRSRSLRDVDRAGLAAWALLVGYALFAAFPLYWTLNTALKPPSLVNTFPPTLFPREATLGSLLWVLSNSQTQQALVDSVVVASGTTVVSVCLGSLAGYGLARTGRGSGEAVAVGLLATRALPPVALVLPTFLVMGRVGIDDSYVGLVLLYLAFNLPLTTWLMRAYVAGVPVAYEEAAFVAGYSRLATLRRVVFPLVRPGLVVTALLAWVFAWNEFLFAIIVAGNRVTPYTVILPLVGGWTRLMALAVVVVLPPTLVLLAFREHVVTGLTLGVVDD
jgi:multiple sugar transport system permease protein